MTVSRDAILFFFKEGYRVSDSGQLVKPDGTVAVTHQTRDGYHYYNTRLRNHPKYGDWQPKVPVHRLAAFQLFGEKVFSPKLQVCHTDGNAGNNELRNLRLGTPSENMMDIPESVRRTKALKAARTRAKLSDADVRRIREGGLTLKQIMAQYGLSKCCASYVRSGRTYRVLGS